MDWLYESAHNLVWYTNCWFEGIMCSYTFDMEFNFDSEWSFSQPWLLQCYSYSIENLTLTWFFLLHCTDRRTDQHTHRKSHACTHCIYLCVHIYWQCLCMHNTSMKCLLCWQTWNACYVVWWLLMLALVRTCGCWQWRCMISTNFNVDQWSKIHCTRKKWCCNCCSAYLFFALNKFKNEYLIVLVDTNING